MFQQDAFQKAIKLAAISGLRAAMGPALLAASKNHPATPALAVAAMGELVVDKLPLVPSRSSTPLLIPRALAGAWVAKTVMEDEGIDDPWAPAYGAAVAVGAATVAPVLRGILRRVLRVPDPLLGVAEDYLVVTMGTQAVGMSIDDIKQIAMESITEVSGRLLPEVDDSAQPSVAGSM